MRGSVVGGIVLVILARAGAVDLGSLYRMQDSESRRASSADPNWQDGNGDARPIPPGETLAIAELEGPGVIDHIWNTTASPEAEYSRLLVLRMYWDGEEHPSVECPLGDFFAVGHGKDIPLTSAPVRNGAEGRARNCYWPMPFRTSARITLTNEGAQPVQAFFWYVDWHTTELAEDAAYFHARYRQDFPTIAGQNYLIADIAGRGHYVGTVLNVRQRTAGWWGEGDDFFFIDGAEEPTLRGTGSEDYFCDAWGFREQTGPYYGVSLFEGYDAYSLTTAYRWHIPDPVHFAKSLRVEIEHKGASFHEDGSVKSGFEERADDFSSVAYWYQTEPHKAFAPMPTGYARLYYAPEDRVAVEMENQIDQMQATSGDIQVQDLATAKQAFWLPTTPDQQLRIPFELEESGVYSVVFRVTHSWDYGIYQFQLDGRQLGPARDYYHSSVATREWKVPPMPLDAGSHVLEVLNQGKNPQSTGYLFGIDGITFLRED